MQCGAEHQAVRHHTEGTGGAARHAGCSGQMRPCVTARRRRQGSVGQVRECTGPAMPQHTYTQRAHNTHSPARLPVPVGRHPGLCLLVTAPSAHHATPWHTMPNLCQARHDGPFTSFADTESQDTSLINASLIDIDVEVEAPGSQPDVVEPKPEQIVGAINSATQQQPQPQSRSQPQPHQMQQHTQQHGATATDRPNSNPVDLSQAYEPQDTTQVM